MYDKKKGEVIMTNKENIIKYYNKFNEDKRLTRRHGIVEYTTSMKYIHEYLKKKKNPKIIDIGAGTGKYSIPLAEEGYNVTAIDIVKRHLTTIKNKTDKVKTILKNATDLSTIEDNTFDITILFGPMYHLITESDKIQALQEAKRITKNNGYIFISYYMNDYAIIKHGFMDKNIKESLKKNLIDNNFHITPKKDDLYSMVRLEDINKYKKITNLKRIKILAQDGPSDYIRKYINDLDEEEFNLFLKYHLSTCERKELLGASSHVLDILKKETKY